VHSDVRQYASCPHEWLHCASIVCKGMGRHVVKALTGIDTAPAPNAAEQYATAPSGVTTVAVCPVSRLELSDSLFLPAPCLDIAH
jgi:hypothetical protein